MSFSMDATASMSLDLIVVGVDIVTTAGEVQARDLAKLRQGTSKRRRAHLRFRRLAVRHGPRECRGRECGHADVRPAADTAA